MTRTAIARAAGWWALGLVGAMAGGQAHELQPGYLELTQTGSVTYDVVWKVPTRGNLHQGVQLVWPEGTVVGGAPQAFVASDAFVERFSITCAGGLEGRRISVDGPAAKLFDVLIRIVRRDGAVQVARLTPWTTSYDVEAAPSLARKIRDFLKEGVDHILTGVDHLLFVLGLLLIVHDRWMLVKTITSFTIAHSITLGIATLGCASAPAEPLNAAIALSILFLGPEMVRARRGQTSLTIRHPWVVAFAFGLLHGFGFASGLTALGLERGEIPLALLCFNVGVELGQLLFVLLVIALAWSFRTLLVRWPRWVTWLPPYTVGALGAYWTIQRSLVFLGALR